MYLFFCCSVLMNCELTSSLDIFPKSFNKLCCLLSIKHVQILAKVLRLYRGEDSTSFSKSWCITGVVLQGIWSASRSSSFSIDESRVLDSRCSVRDFGHNWSASLFSSCSIDGTYKKFGVRRYLPLSRLMARACLTTPSITIFHTTLHRFVQLLDLFCRAHSNSAMNSVSKRWRRNILCVHCTSRCSVWPFEGSFSSYSLYRSILRG